MNLEKRSEVKKRYKKFYRYEESDSEPERLLFEKLVRGGFRPEKQFPVGPFFLDLAYPTEMIAIEYDGKHHLDRVEQDLSRDNYIKKAGWKLFRIKNTGAYKVINCWGTIVGIFFVMEEAMDCLVKEVCWHIRRNNFGEQKREIKTMATALLDRLNSMDRMMSDYK